MSNGPPGWNGNLTTVLVDPDSNLPYKAGGGVGGAVTVDNWPATQPVSISGSVPVTGTFYPATQPVSLATAPVTPVTDNGGSLTVDGTVGISGTVPVSGTFFQATQPVSIASMPTTPVTGTFFQATQPVSLAVAPTTPVTGTFWQATQPVSIASMPSTPVTGTFWQATQPVSGTVTANAGSGTFATSLASLPALAAGAAYAGQFGQTCPGTPITANSGNVANGSAAATLAGTSNKTTWITGFQITASGATAAKVVSVTVTGLISGTLTQTFTFPAGATVAAQPLLITFPTPIPASAQNTSIVVTLPASGTGGTNATVSAQGFQL